MDTSFSFKICTELTTSSESGSVALTKKLNFWQMLKTSWAANVRIRRILFIYEPRAGELGRGQVTAEIIDNRIDEDIDSNVIRSITFDARQKVHLTWEHDVQLHVGDLKISGSEPIILRTSVSGSNMKDGFSLGQIRINIEIATYNKMLPMIKTKQPVAKLSPIPSRSIDRCASFSIKDKVEKPAARLGPSKSMRYALQSD
ncbi:putative P3 protein [Trifolium pratense virus A]|uniref:Putative P3 protein n=1 Tax=Trifolium pratense virus A TaxID=2448906 RepID=A0A510C2C8_9RHAB|nr:putative P3 protein [Trifolium pratense virus A]AYH53276.1 putative P3 protein [Trifolium pratense virus A]